MNCYVSGGNVNGRPCFGISHKIKSGDTLYKLSKIYDVSIADIIWRNPGVRIYNLQIGDELCIPVSNSEDEPDEKDTMLETFPYITHEGESCEDILAQFEMTEQELRSLNPNEPLYYREGTVLNIVCHK